MVNENKITLILIQCSLNLLILKLLYICSFCLNIRVNLATVNYLRTMILITSLGYAETKYYIAVKNLWCSAAFVLFM